MTRSSEPFIPLTARHGMDSRDFTMRSRNVEPHLEDRLWEWCLPHITDQQVDQLGDLDIDEIEELEWTAGLSDAARRMCLQLKIRAVSASDLKEHLDMTPDDFLNVVDWLLHSASVLPRTMRVLRASAAIKRILEDGGSAWTVAPDGGGLIERVHESEVAEAYVAMDADGQTSNQLRAAWDAAWRIKPSAKEAYSGAIEALEGMLAPIVTPDDPKPTLGKMIAALRDKPEKWDTRFRGVETVEALTAMLNEVWVTQARHGAGLPNTLDEARDAVSIAVAVVALCRRGFLERFGELTPEEEAEDQAIAAEWAAMSPEERHADAVPIEEVIASLPAAQG